MQVLRKREVASVMLFEIEVSQDELDVYKSCMRYVQDNLDNEEIERLCGASSDELLGMYEDVLDVLNICTNSEI